MKFQNILRQLRKSARLTQDELALKLGYSKSTISMYENGNREPDLETLENIADFFNVDINMLTGNKPAKAITQDEAVFLNTYRRAKGSDSAAVKAVLKALVELLQESEQENDEKK